MLQDCGSPTETPEASNCSRHLTPRKCGGSSLHHHHRPVTPPSSNPLNTADSTAPRPLGHSTPAQRASPVTPGITTPTTTNCRRGAPSTATPARLFPSPSISSSKRISLMESYYSPPKLSQMTCKDYLRCSGVIFSGFAITGTHLSPFKVTIRCLCIYSLCRHNHSESFRSGDWASVSGSVPGHFQDPEAVHSGPEEGPCGGPVLLRHLCPHPNPRHSLPGTAPETGRQAPDGADVEQPELLQVLQKGLQQPHQELGHHLSSLLLSSHTNVLSPSQLFALYFDIFLNCSIVSTLICHRLLSSFLLICLIKTQNDIVLKLIGWL